MPCPHQLPGSRPVLLYSLNWLRGAAGYLLNVRPKPGLEPLRSGRRLLIPAGLDKDLMKDQGLIEGVRGRWALGGSEQCHSYWKERFIQADDGKSEKQQGCRVLLRGEPGAP